MTKDVQRCIHLPHCHWQLLWQGGRETFVSWPQYRFLYQANYLESNRGIGAFDAGYAPRDFLIADELMCWDKCSALLPKAEKMLFLIASLCKLQIWTRLAAGISGLCRVSHKSSLLFERHCLCKYHERQLGQRRTARQARFEPQSLLH